MDTRTSVLLAAVLTMSLAAPARADGDPSPIYTSDTQCAYEKASLDGGALGQGRASADIYSAINDGSKRCAKAAALDPANLAQQIWVYFKNPSTGEEGLCAYTPSWSYNQEKVAHFGVYTDPIAPLCGTGLYRAGTVGAVGVNGVWQRAFTTSPTWQRFEAPAG
jgi:uncharacterized low-complexity protein